MKKIAVAAAIYAVLLFIGGIIGYFKVNSLPSLIASSLSGTVMLFSSFLMNKENIKGYYLSLGSAAFLLLFFIYRFQIGFKFMPAGLMVVLTALYIGYAFFNNHKK